MKKITLSDFTGGIQESLSPGDFTQRQWSQLKGIVPASNVNFETQWPIQKVGTTGNVNFQAVFPLSSTDGVFLVGIKTTPTEPENPHHGTLWWAKAPEATADASTAAALTWTQLTTFRSTGWVFDATGTSNPTQSEPAVISNPDYRFICAVPVPVYKYVKDVNVSDTSNPSKDNTLKRELINASGVLINSTTRLTGDNLNKDQVIVAYIDKEAVPPTESNPNRSPGISLLKFPNIRRFPLHHPDGDFINADLGGNSVTSTGPNAGPTVFNWGNGPERMHPYTYIDKNGALNPGTGIIPRANVGTMKGDKLILGDIEWRIDQTTVASKLDPVEAYWVSGGTNNTNFGDNTVQNPVNEQFLTWPPKVPTTGRVLYNQGPGVVYLAQAVNTSPMTTTATEVGGYITELSRVNGIVTVTTNTNANFVTIGQEVQINIANTSSPFEGSYFVGSVDLANRKFTYAQPGKKNQTLSYTGPGASASLKAADVEKYDHRVEVGEYLLLPNNYPDNDKKIFVHATDRSTRISINRNLNTAKHLLNDGNTGPYRGSVYYAEGDLDEFDPRSVLKPSKSDVRIAGMHTLDDTVVVITTAGTQGDGVLRIRGFLSQLHPYTEGVSPNPTAVRIELIKGGVGAADRPPAGPHRNFSCVWPEAGLVTFVDRLGGVFYTDGAVCDRLDRFGPRTPLDSDYTAPLTRQDDHTAALGKHLFVYRAGRLLCFTMIGGEAGRSGLGCWTELVLPTGPCKSFVGAREDLYFINSTGEVMRFATQGPVSERGKINNSQQITVTVSTPTIGSQDEHDRTNWLRFGMTFSSPSADNGVRVTGISIRSGGALAPATTGQPVVHNVPAVERGVLDPVTPKIFADPSVLGEFEVNAGIGSQAVASATVTFTGYVQLKSASFWTSGRSPRRGDK